MSKPSDEENVGKKFTEIWGDGVDGEMGSHVQNTILSHIMRHRHGRAEILVKFWEGRLEIL